MDDQAQGIVDQPVSSDEMAAVDNAASQFGQVIQPTNNADDSNLIQPDNSPSAVIEPSNNATAVSGALNPVDEPSTPEGQPVEGGLATPSDEPVIEPAGPVVEPAPAQPVATPELEVPEPIGDDTPQAVSDDQPVQADVDEPQIQPQPVTDEDVVPAPVGDDTGDTPTAIADDIEEPDQEISEQQVAVDDDDTGLNHPPIPSSENGDGSDEELLEVKQQALQELTPIVSTIDLPPEERFDTYMMIIRASDDKRLVKPAYEAANQITDQDKKARALLDVVNEVNYLTQNGPQSQQIEQ